MLVTQAVNALGYFIIAPSYRPVRLGIDIWALWKVYKYGLWVPAQIGDSLYRCPLPFSGLNPPLSFSGPNKPYHLLSAAVSFVIPLTPATFQRANQTANFAAALFFSLTLTPANFQRANQTANLQWLCLSPSLSHPLGLLQLFKE